MSTQQTALQFVPKPQTVLTDLQREVYAWLFAKGGATAEELERGFPNADHYAPSTLRKRVSELAKLGVVRDSGRKRRNWRNTADMTVWEVTTAEAR